MGVRIELEDFGAEAGVRPNRGADLRAQAAHEEGREEGYREGYEAARAEIDVENRRLIAETAERLEDIALTRASARAEAEARLRPVVEALLRAVAPVAARHGLGDAVAETLEARLAAARDERIALRCAPELADTLAARFGDAVTIRPDAALGAGAARLSWRGGGVDYDADACVVEALGALRRFFGETEDKDEPSCPTQATG